MNKKQKEILMQKFKEQQKLNLKLFKKELEIVGNVMDYKEEKMSLELSIYNSNKSLKQIEEINKLIILINQSIKEEKEIKN